MTSQVVKVTYGKAQYLVTHDDSANINPFRVYFLWNELTDAGLKRRRKQVARYEDLPSCLFYLWDDVCRNDSMPEGATIKETLRRR